MPAPRPLRLALSAAVWLSASAGAAGAQELALKRNSARPQAPACPVQPVPQQPGTAQRDEARQRAGLAQEAAIVGNQRAARELFQRAAQLDPTNEEIAYQFGRTLEDGGSKPEALREYCRYIALAPASADAADVRGRIAALAPPTAPAAGGADRATPEFRAGLASYAQREYEEAERAFTRAIDAAPSWPEAHYNRALARLAQREPAPAVADLRRYLELKPDAADRVAVLNQVALIERPLPFTASGALGRGVIPGLGQFYTRRPVFGTAVLAAAAGGLYYAFQSEEELRQDSVTVDLIGGGTVRQPSGPPRLVTERPNLAVGAAIAGGVTALAALESYIYARRVRSEVLSRGVQRTASVRVRPVPALDPARTAVALHVQLPFGRP